MSLFFLPKAAPVSGGENYAQCKLYFYATGTSTAATVYTDSALTTAHPQPVVADAGGVFAPIYVDPSVNYRVVLRSSGGSLIWDVDPFPAAFDDAASIGEILWPRTTAEIAASVTPTDYAYPAGDVRRYGAIGDDSTDCTSAITNASAVSEVVQFGPGTYRFSQIPIPSGRGTIYRGVGSGTKTVLRHTGGARAFVLSASDTQNVTWHDLTVYCSASTTSFFGFDDTSYDAYGLQWINVECNAASSANTSVKWFHIVGSSAKQKHYFRGFGIKIYGGGTGFYIGDGTAGGYSNDHKFYGVQIQGTTADGVILDDAYGCTFDFSVENCGNGTTTANLRLEGASDDNVFLGRLENTDDPAQLVFFDNTSGADSNRVWCQLSATPAAPNADFTKSGVVLANGIEWSSVQERRTGLTRLLGTATTDPLLFAQLGTDTMGSAYAKFALHADGLMGWGTGTNPSSFSARLYYDSAATALRVVDSNLRAGILEVTDGVAVPDAKTGVALIYVDTNDGDLKVRFSDGTVKVIVADT